MITRFCKENKMMLILLLKREGGGAASNYLRNLQLQDSTPILLRILGLHGFLMNFGHSLILSQLNQIIQQTTIIESSYSWPILGIHRDKPSHKFTHARVELPSSNHPAFQDGYPETVPVAPQYFPAPPRVQAYKTHVVRCPVFLKVYSQIGLKC